MDWFSTVGLSGEESIGIYSCSGEAEEKPALAVWSHCMGERAPVRSKPPSTEVSPSKYRIPISSP